MQIFPHPPTKNGRRGAGKPCLASPTLREASYAHSWERGTVGVACPEGLGERAKMCIHGSPPWERDLGCRRGAASLEWVTKVGCTWGWGNGSTGFTIAPGAPMNPAALAWCLSAMAWSRPRIGSGLPPIRLSPWRFNWRFGSLSPSRYRMRCRDGERCLAHFHVGLINP